MGGTVMQKPPLGLPEGSVRALLALVVVVTVCVMSALGKGIPELLGSLAGLAFGAYFLNRSGGPPPTAPAG